MTHDLHPLVSVIIVNYNGGSYLLDCVDALVHETPNAEVIVVDNASVDGSAQACANRFPRVTVVYGKENLGFAGGANLGATHAMADILVFLNPDTVPDPGCITQLYEELSARGGVVGPVVSSGGYGFTIDRMGLLKELTEPLAPLYVSGYCLGTTRECFEAVGGLDHRYFLFYEDVEYCWQALRRGYDVRVVQTATLEHIGGTAAPGGYRRNNRIETTSARILLGGRNSLTTFLACAPYSSLPVLVCGSLLRNVVFAMFLLAKRRPRDALRLVAGVWWNVKALPTTLRRRHRPGVTPMGERTAWSRVSSDILLWGYVRAREKLRLVDSPRDLKTSGVVVIKLDPATKNARDDDSP